MSASRSATGTTTEPPRGVADFVSLLIGFGMGALIDWVDSRPHWNDAGITAGILFLAAALLSFLWPRRSWLIGLAVGIALWWHLTWKSIEAHDFAVGAILAPVLIFCFPMADAYGVFFLRRALTNRQSA
jgi:hypothetical protein